MLKMMKAQVLCRNWRTAIVLLAGTMTWRLDAQTPPAADTASVTLDMAVRDRHNKPVLDLRPEELAITDNGALVKLNSLQLVNGKSSDEPLITLLFDRPGMQGGSKGSDEYMFGRSAPAARETSRKLREAANRFLKAFPSSGFQFAVVDVWGRLQIQQANTSDRKLITKAISAAVQPEVYSTRVVPNGEEKRQIQVAKTGQDASGAAVSTRDRAIARSMYSALQASSHIAKNQHLSLSLACLLALVEAQAAIPGRKAIVYLPATDDVGEDASNWRSQDGHAKDAIHSIVGAANRAGINVYIVIPDSIEDNDQLAAIYSTATLGSYGPVGGVDLTGGQTLMMGNATSFAMATMATRKPSAIASQDNLNVLARQTGGDVINAGGRMAAAIRDLTQGLTTYYETSFAPPSGLLDGSFHTTSYKTTRSGLRMRARTGYLALPPSVGLGEPPQPFELPLMALLKSRELPGDIDYRAGVLRMGRQDEGNVNLVAMEIPVSALQVQEDSSTHLKSAHLSVLATITDSTGLVVERFSEDMARRWAAGSSSGTMPEFLPFERTFSAPPGKYTLETAVLDNLNGKAAARRQTFEIAPSQPGPELSDLMVVRSVEPVDVAGGDPDLLWRGNTRVLPNMYGQLPAGVHNLSVFLFARTDSKAQEPATVMFEVLHDGVPLKGKPLESTLKPGDELTPVTKSFAISSATDGRYEIRVTLKQGDKSAESTGEFVLAGGEEPSASSGTGGAPLEIDPPGLTADDRPDNEPTPAESELILADVRKNALDYGDTLPNLICQQTTTRLTDPRGIGNWQLKDKLVEVLTYVNHQESRQVIGGEVNHAKKDEKTVSEVGMISTGEFGMALTNIFTPSSKAVFTRKGTSMLHGEPVEAFDYRIEQANSNFSLTVPTASVKVAYHGRVYIDSATHGVRSITIITDDVPKKFPIRSAAVRVDYDYIAINEHDYLLPVSAQVIAGRGANLLERNDLHFSNFRKFGSNARILGVDNQSEESDQ
jgi:VWFA-related protein